METKNEEKLSVINPLKQATRLLCGNINLALFLFLCSLPLFCFLIFFELSLQTTISLTSHYLSRQLDFEEGLLENDLIPWLIHTSLLYFFPYTFIDLLATTTIVAATSIVYTSEKEPLGMLYLVRRSIRICQKSLGGCVITSLYVLLWSTSVFFGFFSDSTNYLFIASISRKRQSFSDPASMLFHAVVVLIHVTVFILVTAKFSKWSAGWNMSLVISVLEEDENGQGIYGTDALSLSDWYGRGYEKRDLWIMLMFLVYALAMRMPCLYCKCSESWSGNGMLYTGLYVGLICAGNVIKWVTCVVCYQECDGNKTRALGKKGDVEEAKSSAT